MNRTSLLPWTQKNGTAHKRVAFGSDFPCPAAKESLLQRDKFTRTSTTQQVQCCCDVHSNCYHAILGHLVSTLINMMLVPGVGILSTNTGEIMENFLRVSGKNPKHASFSFLPPSNPFYLVIRLHILVS